MPVITPTGGGGGSVTRPFISDVEPGVVVNRAGGFVSPWETFDLQEPGVGYGAMAITAAVADGETWATTIGPSQDVQVSFDGLTWVDAYTNTFAGSYVALLDISASGALNPVGKGLSYCLFTPRFIRFRGVLTDPGSGGIYAGANNPTFTFTFTYTAG